jgi:flagellar hook-associated protein FlgK
MLSSLNTSYHGLLVSRTQIDTASNNISNSNTEGFHKRTVNVSEIHNTIRSGNGATVKSITRNVNESLFSNIKKIETSLSYNNTLLKSLNEFGFDSSSSNIKDSYQNLKDDFYSSPELLKNRLDEFNYSIENIVSSFNDSIESSHNELTSSIDKVNSIFDSISSLNEKISNSKEGNYDLVDKRDSLEQELSTFINFSVEKDEHSYKLKVNNNLMVLNNSSNEITVESSKESIKKNGYDYIKYQDSINIMGQQISPSIIGGSISASLEISNRNTNLTRYQDNIIDFSNNVNNITNERINNKNEKHTTLDTISPNKILSALHSDVEGSKNRVNIDNTKLDIFQSKFDREIKTDVQEEMINIMKFKAAYEANIKMIQTIDSLIQTTLDMKR